MRVCDGICLKVGFCQSERKIKKITEMKGCGASFMGLEGLLGDYIRGGVTLIIRLKSII